MICIRFFRQNKWTSDNIYVLGTVTTLCVPTTHCAFYLSKVDGIFSFWPKLVILCYKSQPETMSLPACNILLVLLHIAITLLAFHFTSEWRKITTRQTIFLPLCVCYTATFGHHSTHKVCKWIETTTITIYTLFFLDLSSALFQFQPPQREREREISLNL